MYYNTTAMARFEGRWEVCPSCAHCTLVFTETLLFCSDYVAFFPINDINSSMLVMFLINHRITTVWAVLIVVQRGAQWRRAPSQHNFRSDSGIWSPCSPPLRVSAFWTLQLHYKLNRTSEEAWKGSSNWPLSHFCSLFFVSAVCLQAVAGQRIGLFSLLFFSRAWFC